MSNDEKKLLPQYRRLNSARKEHSRRSPKSEYLKRLFDARGPSYPFGLKPGTSEFVLALSELETYLCHAVITKVDKFAKRETFLCTGLRLPDDPDQPGFVSTGEPCAFCAAFGDPRPVAAMIVGTFRKEEARTSRDGTPIPASPVQARVLIASQSDTQNALGALANSRAAEGSLAFLRIKIVRGSDNKSCKVGTAFIFDQSMRGEKRKAIPHPALLSAAFKQIDLTKIFGPLDLEEQRAALVRHKMLVDQSPWLKLNYDIRAMERAISGDMRKEESLDDLASSSSTSDWDAGSAWDGLDDIEQGAASTDSADQPADAAPDETDATASEEATAAAEDPFSIDDWEDTVGR